MTARFFLRFAVAVTAVALLTSCVGRFGHPANQPSATADGVRIATVNQTAEVYVVPNSDTRLDGQGTLLITKGGTRTTSRLGPLTEVGVRADRAGGFVVAAFGQGNHGAFFPIRPGQSRPAMSVDVADGRLPVVGDDGTHYFIQVGASIRALDQDGKLWRTIPMKIHAAPKGSRRTDKAVSTDGPGLVVAYVTASDGTTYSIANTFTTIEITNLTTAQTAEVSDYNSALDAAVDASGNLMLLAWDSGDNASTAHVLWVNGQTLTLNGAADTGVAPAATNLTGFQLLRTANYGTFVFLAASSDTTTDEWLWMADAQSMTITAATQLPDGAGISAAVDPSDTLYFFNGPAQNIVSSWSPSTGKFTSDVPELDGPPGSYVTGLAF